jgi:hypothetical protein
MTVQPRPDLAATTRAASEVVGAVAVLALSRALRRRR